MFHIDHHQSLISNLRFSTSNQKLCYRDEMMNLLSEAKNELKKFSSRDIFLLDDNQSTHKMIPLNSIIDKYIVSMMISIVNVAQ